MSNNNITIVTNYRSRRGDKSDSPVIWYNTQYYNIFFNLSYLKQCIGKLLKENAGFSGGIDKLYFDNNICKRVKGTKQAAK